MPNVSSTIKHVTYSSQRYGPALLVLGGVHGNETCGPAAINRVLAELDSGAVTLARGQVTFVPVCNPEAARQDKRFVERNLNRFLVPVEAPDTYEARLGNLLCPLLEQCDVLLDLHSYSSGDLPFVFVDQNENLEERAFAKALGPENMVTGWEQAYAAAGRKPPQNPDEPTGTTEYARRFGAIGVTLECGQHKAADAPQTAYAAIHNAMRHLGLIESPGLKPAGKRLVTVRTVIYRQREGRFPKAWKNLAPVSAGEAIAIYEDGETLTAPVDGFLIMPHEDTPIATEWYYFGTE